MTSIRVDTGEPTELTRLIDDIQTNVGRVLEGKPEAVRLAVIALLAEGHLLVEDVPGVGKTLLAKALARSVDCSVKRIQFTPDLLPSDVTGVSIYNQEQGDFEFRPGAVFANIVLGDEINRASPRTQSALLEAMEERQVSADGVTYGLGSPFMVIATQNPIEHEGTYPLPEAQRDRFLLQVSLGYPDREAELAILDTHGSSQGIDQLMPVTDAPTVAEMIRWCTTVHAAPSVKEYVVDLVRATRSHPAFSLGASPRAGLALLRAARAAAASTGRSYVIPDDIHALARPVLAHRLVLTPEAQLTGRNTGDVVEELVRHLPVPVHGGQRGTWPGGV